jgi:serine phosphatase RsbU (regulator of sigma subunit)
MRVVDKFATKLVVAALLVSAVPLGILGFYAYDRIAGTLEQDAVAMAIERVSQAGRLIRFMQARVERDVLLFLARPTALRTSQAGAADAGAEAVNPPERSEAPLGSGGGRSAGERRTDLSSFIQARPFYRGVLYLDTGGNEVLRVDADESRPSTSAQPFRQSEDFTRTMALARNQVYISPVFVEEQPAEADAPARMLIRYGAPVFNQQGKPQGVVILTVAVDELFRQAREALSGEDVISFIADERGHYLHHTVARMVWNAPENPETAGVLQRDFPAATEGLAETPVVKELGDGRVMVVEEVRAGPSGSLSTRGSGVSFGPPGFRDGGASRPPGARQPDAGARQPLDVARGGERVEPVTDAGASGSLSTRSTGEPPAGSRSSEAGASNPRETGPSGSPKTGREGGPFALGSAPAAASSTLESAAADRKWVVGQVYRRDVIFRPVLSFRWTFLSLVTLTAVIAALVAAGLAHHLTGPVRELQAGTRLVGGGDLDHRIPVRSRDEFGELAASFNTMAQQLAEHLQHIQETTAARARTEGELRTAREIQQALLPRRLPPFPGMESLEVFGNNIPAYEVGGDFYDCQPVGEDRVLLALGDVSGKGVPAALLMTMTSTLLRTFALESRSPSDILIRTNRALLLRGDPRTFVTVFLALYHLQDRRLVYANAGHTRPFLVACTGTVTSLHGGDMPLGVEEAFQPEDVTVQLGVGDRLFLYSDGLTEARDVEGDPFGARRLQELLKNTAAPSAQQLYDEVVGAVMKHEAGAPQFDDLAVLVVKVK